MQSPKIDPELAREAKAIVALAFRNGPIESIHSGKTCPTCSGKAGYSKVTDAEMKLIMKNAVDHLYKFSVIKKTDPIRYQEIIEYGDQVRVSGMIQRLYRIDTLNPTCHSLSEGSVHFTSQH